MILFPYLQKSISVVLLSLKAMLRSFSLSILPQANYSQTPPRDKISYAKIQGNVYEYINKISLRVMINKLTSMALRDFVKHQHGVFDLQQYSSISMKKSYLKEVSKFLGSKTVRWQVG